MAEWSMEDIEAELAEEEKVHILKEAHDHVMEVMREQADAEKKATELEKTQNTLKINTDLLKNQIKIMGERFNPELLQNYSCTPDQLNTEFNSADEAVLKNGLQRVLMACNHQLMLANGQNIGADVTAPRCLSTVS